MLGLKQKLGGLLLVTCATVALTGCGPQAPTYVPTPPSAKYGTGVQLSKTLQARILARETVVAAVLKQVGTFDTAAHQQALSYDNLHGVSYDLAANSPVFVTGNKTTVKCAPGKNLGTDIGQGFYLVGDTFLLPTAGHTLTTAAAVRGITRALPAVAAGGKVSKTTAGDKTPVTYNFKIRNGDQLRVAVYGVGQKVSGIRISTVLSAKTCADLKTLPTTTGETVMAWKKQVAALS